MEYQELGAPQNLYSSETPTSAYSVGNTAIERLQNLATQRANYNAQMMRKAEDRYASYMAEMRRRYDDAHRKRPWWKKMLGGLFGGGATGAIVGGILAAPTGGMSIAAGAGLGALAGGTLGGTQGAIGAGGESGMGGMMPMETQLAMMGALHAGGGPKVAPTNFEDVVGGSSEIEYAPSPGYRPRWDTWEQGGPA